MNLGKLLRQYVRAILWPFLKAQGFTEFSDLAAWRRGPRWIDCVQVMTLGATEFGEPKLLGWRDGHDVLANAATFSLDLGCYYTDVHLLPWTGPVPARPRCPRGQGPKYPTCHRLRSLARSYDYGNVQGTLYPSANDGSDLEAVVQDALLAFRTRGLAWLDEAHDIDRFLARLDGEPSEYLETQGGPIDLSDEDQSELARWMEARGIEEGEPFTLYGAFDAPAFVARLQQSANLRDHTAASSPLPYGDLLYGLLLGSGRMDEALAAMRRDDDPAPDELRYTQMLSLGSSKREVNAIRRREGAYRERTREHQAMLEASLSKPTPKA